MWIMKSYPILPGGLTMAFLLFALICIYIFLEELSRGIDAKDLVKVPSRRRYRESKQSGKR